MKARVRRAVASGVWMASLTLAALTLAALTVAVGLAGLPAVAAPRLASWPVTVTLQTVPPLADVLFTVDGHRVRTGRSGQASYTGQHDYRWHTVALLDTEIATTGRRYAFVRWAGQRDPDQAYRPVVTGLPLRASYTITAGFRVRFPVRASFVDQFGQPLPAGRITAASVRSDEGDVVAVPLDAGVMWLEGATPVYRNSMLTLSEVWYGLNSVTIGGANAIEPGRNRFRPSREGHLAVTVMLHELTVGARDALFGSATGRSIRVTGADGIAQTATLRADGTATVSGLPRGVYTVEVLGAPGVVPTSRFTLSGNRTVAIRVIGWLDLGLGALAVLLAGAGVLLAGRAPWRRLLRSILRRLTPSGRRQVSPVWSKR